MLSRLFRHPTRAILQFVFLLPLCAAGMDSVSVQVRREASQGRWKEADARLNAWKNDPRRREGGGEVLFWQGWAALHQHRREEADTLFILASAYTDQAVSQRALEYRLALLLDSSQALYAYIRGLPESPLPDSLRSSALKEIPTSSPLYPYGVWETAMMAEKKGDKAAELALLQELAASLSSLPGRKAQARLAWLKFEPNSKDSAMSAYERLLLQYQQGVPSEFARSRVQILRGETPSKSAP
jgi:hypothetical protein